MTISADKIQRASDAVAALQALTKEFSDVLLVLDYVSVNDVLNFDDVDADLSAPVSEILTDDDVASILWHLGKHAGGYETSATILPNIVQYVLDEHERKSGTR